MASEADRRIQLRESIHELVVMSAARRCVTPAAFVSMVMYAYLKAEGELDLPKSAAKSKPITKVISDAPECLSTSDMLAMGIKLPSDVATAWGDDDDDEEEFNVGD